MTINYQSYSIMKYKTPLCKSFSVMPEGIICVSGTGNIDDGSQGGNYDLTGIDAGTASPIFDGLDNSLLF